jgi:hypothetical protein
MAQCTPRVKLDVGTTRQGYLWYPAMSQHEDRVNPRELALELAGQRARSGAPFEFHLDKDHPQVWAPEPATCHLRSRVQPP